jgi:hypothetical protein
MSATNRGSARIDQDKYYTPSYSIYPLLPLINWDNINSVLEPCAGRGIIVKTIREYLNDIDHRMPYIYDYDLDTGIDYLSTSLGKFDICITNPPYNRALEFIQKALNDCPTVVMLLRLNFLGSQERKSFWRDNPPTHILTLSKRPSFVSQCPYCKMFYNTGDYIYCVDCQTKLRLDFKLRETTDATEYAWFCWDGHNNIIADPIMVI